MEFIVESLRDDWQAFLAFSPRLLYGLVVLTLAWLAARLAGNLLGRIMQRSERLRTNERYVRRLVVWAIKLLGVLLALGVMGFSGVAASLLATGGVVAIVLGFAFREIGENLLAGIFLTFSRPFERGDLIQTGDLIGEVRAIFIRSVHIRTADACDVFVPCAQIFRQELYNYTRDGLRRPSFRVGVAYQDDPQQVLALLANATADVEDVLSNPPPVVSIHAFTAGWIEYEVLFFTDVTIGRRDLAAVSNDVKIACWRALREQGFTFSTDVTTALEIRSLPPLELERSPQS